MTRLFPKGYICEGCDEHSTECECHLRAQEALYRREAVRREIIARMEHLSPQERRARLGRVA